LTGPHPTAVHFRAAPQEHFAWACEDTDDPVLYFRPSSQTHFVNAATALLLRQVLREPRDLESAGRALARAQGVDAGPDWLAHLSGLLGRLEELGLVEREPTR